MDAIPKQVSPPVANTSTVKASITNMNATLTALLPSSTIPTTMVMLSYFGRTLNTRVFSDMGSWSSLTFGSEVMSKILQLVRV